MNSILMDHGAELSALSSLFIRLLNISIAAGWIAAAAAILRKLLKRAPKWVVCLLWLVLALRLVMPFSIESPLSLIPSAETVVITGGGASSENPLPGGQSGSGPQTDAGKTGIEIHSGFDQINDYINPRISETIGGAQTGTDKPAIPSENSSDPANDPVAVADAKHTADPSRLIDGFGVVWAAGLTIMICYAAVSYIRLKRKVGASVLWAGSANTFVCDDIDTPFILGVFSPKIYLPSGLSAAETGHVMAHERAHITRRDHLWKPLGFALLAVYWFNPLMWLAYILFCRDIELACDEKVVRDMDEGSKAAYSRTLVSCSSRQRLVAACPLAFGEVGTKERVRSVLNYRKPAFWIIAAAVVVCIALAVCFLTDPKKGSMTSYRKPPALKISCGQNSVSADAQTYTWTHKGIFGTSSVAVDGTSPENLEKDGKLKTLDVSAGAKVTFNIELPPELASAVYEDAAGQRYLLTVDPQDGSITLPKSADGYLSFSLYWSEDGKQNSAYYIIKVTGDGSGSGSVDPDPLQPQESGTITLDSGYTYTKTDISLAFVPEGFKYAGLLSTEEAGETGLDGHEYYRWSWSAIYVKSGDHYEAWLAVDPAAGEGSDMSGDRAMTFPDVLLLAQTRGADLSWDYLKPYRSRMPFSGIYARIYYIAGTNYYFYAGGSSTDKISEARLVHIPTGDSIDIFSESFTDFISKHPLTAAPESAKNMDNMTIVVGGKRYYAAEGHTRYLPYGYTGINWLTAVEAENTNLASARYYVADRREDIYVESTYCSQQTIGGKTAYVTELVYIRFSPDPQPEPELRLDDIINLAKKVSIARSDLSRYPRLDDDTGGGQSYTFQVGGIYTAFIRFGKDGKADIFNLFYDPTWESVDVLTQDVKAFIDRHYVVRIYDSASDKLEVENTPAESFWTENGLTFCFPQARSSTIVVETADGSSTPLIKALVNKQILVTDIPRFGFEVQIRGLYEGDLTGLIPEEARLAQLKHYYPAIFEVDASKGLTIYVSSFAEGRYTCGLLPADVNNVGISGSGGKGCVDYYDMELVLRYGYSQVPDSSITIRPYYDPLSSYMIPDKNAYEKELRELFNGRFKVGDLISY